MRRVTSLLIVMLLFAGGIWGQVPGPNLNEGFEDGMIPDNWTILNADGGTKVWTAQTSNPHTGLYCARVQYESSSLNNDDWLITPPLHVTSATTDEISFWMRTYSATYADAWEVLVSTTNTSPASFTMIDSGDGMLGEYVQKTYSLDEYGDAVVYLAVRYMGAYDWYLYVDDFTGPPVMVPTCPKPTGLTAENATISSIELGWTPGNTENMWDVLYGAAGFDPETEGTLVEGIEANPYLLENLTSSTVYEFYVRADCGTDEVSEWAGPTNFSTLCDIFTLPFAENFDGDVFPPLCWNRYSGLLTDTTSLTVATFGWSKDDWRNVTGTDKAAKINIYGSSRNHWLVTPEIDLGDGTMDYQLEFDLALMDFGNSNPPDTNGVDDKFAIVISLDGGLSWYAANTLRLFDNAGSAYVYNEISSLGQRVVIPLTGYTGVVKLGFYGESTVSNADNDLMVNNLLIRTPPACLEPSVLIAQNPTINSIDLSWTPGGDETAWDIAYGEPGFDPNNGTIVPAATNPFTLTGLTEATSYEVFVRADCGTDEVSTWVGPVAFDTKCNPIAIPFTESFDGEAFPPLCWHMEKTAGTAAGLWDRQTAGTSPTCVPHSGAAMTRFNCFSYSTGTAGILVTPAFDVTVNTVGVNFWMYRDNGYLTNADRVNVYYNTEAGLTGAVLLGTVNRSINLEPVVDTTSWYQYTFASPAGVIGDEGYFIIEGVSGYGNNIFVDDVEVFEPQVGSLAGTVSEASRGVIEGAMITAGSSVVYTDEFGYYEIPGILPGYYTVSCEAEGYFPVAVDSVEIVVDQTATQDFVLGYAQIAVTPTSLLDTLPPDGISTQMLSISNPGGTEPLSWSASVELLETAPRYNAVPVSFSEPVSISSNNSANDVCPTSSIMKGDLTDATWDILQSFSTAEAGEQAVGTDGQYIYTTFWGGAGLFGKYQLDGTWIENFTIASAAGIRDFAYDGQYFYGGASGSTLFILDFTTQTQVGTIALQGGATCRHIAYDPTVDGFWVGNWTTLFQVDKTGAVLQTGPAVVSVYGSAYDGVTPGGPYLWLFAQVGTDGCGDPANDLVTLQQFDIATMSFTGVVHCATDIPGYIPGVAGSQTIAGGAFATDLLVPGKFVLMVNVQQSPNLIGVYELALLESWLTIDTYNGTINPGETQDITVTFDATGLIDTNYYANININHDGQELTDATVTVPVELVVESAQAPQAATDPMPMDGAQLVPFQPEFSWINGAGTSTARFVLRKGSGPFAQTIYTSPWIIGNTVNLADAGITLLPKTSYNWQVYCRNAAGTTPSASWSFTTVGVGTIGGVVTDNFGGAPLEGVTVSTDGMLYSATTIADGTYSIAGVIEGDYNVTAALEGYVPQTTPVSVVHGQLSPTNFALDLFLDPPTGLQAQVVDFTDVHVSWQSPAAPPPTSFSEGFEGGTLPTGWLAIDQDGDGFNWINTIEQGFGFEAHTGLGAMTSASYDNTAGALFPDNWLITPAIEVTAESVLSWWHSAQDPLYPDDFYNVKLSTTGTNLTDFTNTLWSGTTPADWAQVSVTLSTFAGSTCYIAFQHTNSTDWFWMKLDDVEVTNTATRSTSKSTIASVVQHEGYPFKIAGLTSSQIEEKLAAYTYDSSPFRDLTGFNVYRDGDFLVSTAADVTEIDDLDLEAGTYAYTVKAAYPQGESEAVGPKTVAILPSPVLLSAEADYYGVDLLWEEGNNYPENLDAGGNYSLSNIKDDQAKTEKEVLLHGPTNFVPAANGSRATGDDCVDPLILDLTTLPLVDTNTTCGRVNTYSETCLGNYDSGEDIVYQFTLTEAKTLKFILETATTYTGMLITQECPIGENCISFVTGYDGNKNMLADLEAGTYYIMIDTWAAPDCIPEFTLTIEEFVPQPGEICSTAVTAVEGLNSAPAQPYWYEFTPAEDKAVTISSCIEAQTIDTKLEVYDACGGNLIASNDDMYAECSYYNYASGVTFNATAGVSYKILWLDAYSSEAFDFTIELNDICVVECPPDAIAEAEPCGDDLNGGCNAEIPAYAPIAGGDVICGTSWAYDGLRDTDWYELVLDETKTITWTATAEFPVLIFIVNANSGDCSDYEILDNTTAIPCETATLSATVPPGTYWLLVMPSVFEGTQCGSYNNYVAELTLEDAFLAYFNVFRDGDGIAEIYTGNTYRDEDIVNGETYCYTVSKVESPAFETGLSNELCATVPLIPEMVVNPDSFSKVLYVGTTEMETLTIENTGPGVLDFDIDIMINAKDNTVPEVEWNFHKNAVGASAQSNTPSKGKEPNNRVDELLWDNLVVGSTSGIVSVDLTGILPDGRTITADDFVVPAGETWTINYVYSEGFSNQATLPDAFGVEFYTNDGGKPGTLISAEDVVPANINFETQELVLTNPVVLEAGQYWLSVYGVYEGGNDISVTRWNWYTGPDAIGNEASLQDFAGLFGLDPGWFYLSEIGVADAASCSFQLEGTKGAASSWISMDVTSGSIDGVGQADLDLTFDAGAVEPGFYTASLNISSNDPLLPMLSVPVELEVYVEEGILNGHITDATSKGPVKGVTITAEEIRYSTTTDDQGYYEMVLPKGFYSVTASKDGYISQTVDDVLIEYEGTNTLDFMLDFAAPELLYANGGVGEISLGWDGNPVFDGDNIRGGLSTNNQKEAQVMKMSKEEQEHGITARVPMSNSGRAIGDDCDNPKILDMTTFPVFDTDSTCGHGNNYEETCLDYYDSGEDIVYQFTIDEAMDLEFVLTTETTWTGMLITQECPIGENCVATITGSSANKTLLASLEAGTYYLMIDTYASPDCIPEFTLEINEFIPQPGEICETAIDYGNVNDEPALGAIESYGAVWYSFTADQDYDYVDVSLCGSNYDTKLEVWYACDNGTYAYYNDDSPECDAEAAQSFISTGYMAAGETWYAKIYGYSSNAGDYVLSITGADPCTIECPPGAIAEGEECPGDEYVDTFNGGCNSDVPVFTQVNCGDVVCGTASTYLFEGSSNRDTDWYELTITEPKSVTFNLTAEFPFIGGLIEQIEPGVPGCDNTIGSIAPYVSGEPCEDMNLTVELIPGTYYFFVSLGVFDGYPCGTSNDYIASWECAETFIGYFDVIRDGDVIAQTYGTTYTDTDIEPDVEYCYTVNQYIEPELTTGESNQLCATMLCASGCDYTLELTDLYGDGWNGASITVIQDGLTLGIYTVPVGGALAIYDVMLCDATETSLVWTEGSWDGECGFTLYSPEGDSLYSFVAGGAPLAGEFFNFITECPPIPEQLIALEQGWNAWSSYRDPDSRMGMEAIMAPVIDKMEVTMYFNQLYYPFYGINNMGDFSNNHGYFTMMNEAATLPISGLMADPTVMLTEGWNLMPVLQECSIPAVDVFSNLPGLIIAWEVGNGIYYPAGNLFTLDNLNPGKAYWVKVDADVSYTYPGCEAKGGSYSSPLRAVNNTNWNDVVYTPVNHAVVFDANAVASLQAGDMIGAFTSNGWCAGLVEYTEDNLGFNLFGDDMTTDFADGFVEGENLSYRLFRPATEEEFDIDVTYSFDAPDADGLFAINGVSVVTDLKLSPTSVGANLLNGLNIYPNPSTGVFNIALNNIDENINFVVMNVQGQEVYRGNLLETQELDLSAEPRGVYFIKFMNNGVLGIEKLVIK